MESGAGIAASSATAEPPVQSPALLRVARGFSCLFWGIPLGLLLFFSQTAGLHGTLALRTLSGLRLPTYIIATLLMYAGALYLYRAGPVATGWLTLTRRTLFALFLQLYFAPFYHWWDGMPHESFFAFNVMGLMLCVITTLFLINLLAARVGQFLQDDTFEVEARLCGWAVIALMAFPFLSILGYSIVTAQRNESSLYAELARAHQQIPLWTRALFLLPFFLTMAATWKAKETCLRHVQKLERRMRATLLSLSDESDLPDRSDATD